MECPACRFDSPPGFKFCGQCGAAIPEPPPETRSRADESVSPAERRHLTVMFCDLVDSTALSERLDPEDLRDVIREYQRVAGRQIERYDGHVAQHLGDGMLAYFGYPRAHEDDARRAVNAGLGIVGAVRDLAARVALEQRVHLAVRVGIHTGTVVTGEVGGGQKRERLALGRAPNLAARLQGLARPDTVVLSAETRELVEGFFVDRSLGEHALKGLSESVEVFEVTAPLLGRARELGVLERAFGDAGRGEGRAVFIKSEAGVGKSRLVHELKTRVTGEPHTWWTCRCSPYFVTSAFHPLNEPLRGWLGIRRRDSAEEARQRLAERAAELGLSHEEAVPLLAAFLSIPVDGGQPSHLSPQLLKTRTLELLCELVRRLARGSPLVLAFEDLHWVDPSTVGFLELLLERGRSSGILLILTARPGFEPPRRPEGHLVRIELEHLEGVDIEKIVEHLAGGKPLPSEVVARLVERADGVPIFAEELTKMVLESGLLRETDDHFELAGPLPELSIPATLKDSLMARLDRLARVKKVAQLGSVLGREFAFDVLQEVARLEEDELRRRLARLVEAGLVFERDLVPPSYFFKHAMIQEAAYQSLLKEKRRQYHAAVVQALEEKFPEVVAAEPEVVAHHSTEAGEFDRAADYWFRAGERDLLRFANHEAVNHLQRALDALGELPDALPRRRLEIAVELALGNALGTARGWGAEEVGEAYSRAYALSDQVGAAPELFWILRGLWAFYLIRTELERALQLARQMQSLAETVGDAMMLVSAHVANGFALFFRGELSESLAHLEQACALDPGARSEFRPEMGMEDDGVNALAYGALVLWNLGREAEALEWARDARELAERLGRPFLVAHTLVMTIFLHGYRRDEVALVRAAEELLFLSGKYGLFLDYHANFFLGRAAVLQGDEGGWNRMQESWETQMALGILLGRTSYLSIWAATRIAAGRLEEAHADLAEIRDIVERLGERFWETQLHLLEGELALARGSESAGDEAEQAFRLALAVARRQKAMSLELMAALRLGRHLQGQGRGLEATELLSELCGHLGDHAESVGLGEARGLLKELAGG